MSEYAVIGEDGWQPASNPPDTDRTVQLAWDDFSTSSDTLGFYSGVNEIPDSGRRFWWTLPSLEKMPLSAVAAWREMNYEERTPIYEDRIVIDECVHNWVMPLDAQNCNEYHTEVICSKCGMVGEKNLKTGNIFFPAT